MLASSRNPCNTANPMRRAKSPALQSHRERAATHKRQPSAKPAGGPMKIIGPYAGGGAAGRRGKLPDAGAPSAVPRSAARLPCIVGRAFTPAGELASAQKYTRKARCRTPQSALPTAPLAGEPSGRQSPKASPARGGGCAARRRRKGALPPCGGDILKSPAGACPVFRRGRCSHRPATPAIPQTPCGGRNRPPYKATGSGRQRTNVSHPPSPPAGR